MKPTKRHELVAQFIVDSVGDSERGTFTPRAQRRLALEIYVFSEELDRAASKVAKEDGSKDEVTERDVEKAAALLSSKSTGPSWAVSGTVGGLLLGGAISNAMTFFNGDSVSSVAALATMSVALGGTVLLVWGFVRSK